MLETVLKTIATPAPEFYAAPFWGWNNRLNRRELLRQMKVFREMHYGGFFIHSRNNLKTEYLGKKWMELCRVCAEESGKYRLIPFLYDEDRWPSGAAGGAVTANPAYRQRFLHLDFAGDASRISGLENVLGVWAGIVDESSRRVTRLRRIKDARREPLRAGETYLAVSAGIFPASEWYNGGACLDAMNPEAVRRFFDSTLEKYRTALQDFSRLGIPAIFTDEPSLLHSGDPAQAPWSETVPGEFKRRFGYDILEHLAELFVIADGREFSRVRLDFRRLVTSLFNEHFTIPYSNWCGEHHLELTGHLIEEDDPVRQTKIAGSAMRFYEHMQSPGIDVLTGNWNLYFTAIQCSSVARQFGRRWRISESPGCVGWDFPLSACKAQRDWQFALGINRFCPNLAIYSLEGQGKRDYPASLSFQSPWWKIAHVLEDYSARVNAALSEGDEIREVLVVHPLESTWGTFADWSAGADLFPDYIGNRKSFLPEESVRFIGECNELLRNNIGFDLGDEDIMARHGGVSGRTLRVGQAVYRAALLPRMRTVRGTTLALLKRFCGVGGQVFFLGDPPTLVDGVPSPEAADCFRACFRPLKEGVNEAFASVRTVSVTDGDGRELEPVLHLLRRADDHEVLFLCNTGTPILDDYLNYPDPDKRRETFPAAVIRLRAQAGNLVYELNLKDGKLYEVKSRATGEGMLEFRTSFGIQESRCFFVCREPRHDAVPRPAAVPVRSRIKLNPKHWRISTDEPNVLVLDHADWKIPGTEHGGTGEFILAVDDALRTLLGVPVRSGTARQPYAVKRVRNEGTLPLEMEYRFVCKEIPAERIFLALEHPEYDQITVNGTELPRKTSSWWCDPSLKKLPLPSEILRRGENTIALFRDYRSRDEGLEAIYLLGRFGVDQKDRLISFPDTLGYGDITGRGFPYYSGNITYQTGFRLDSNSGRILVKPGRWHGTAIGISLNGGKERILAWPPWELECAPELLRSGDNTLAITVYGHRRNSHGPFYLSVPKPVWLWPGSFRTCEQPRKHLVPVGLSGPVELFL